MKTETDLSVLSFWTRKTAEPVKHSGMALGGWLVATEHSLPTGATVIVLMVTACVPVFFTVTESESFVTLAAVIWMSAV